MEFRALQHKAPVLAIAPVHGVSFLDISEAPGRVCTHSKELLTSEAATKPLVTLTFPFYFGEELGMCCLAGLELQCKRSSWPQTPDSGAN